MSASASPARVIGSVVLEVTDVHTYYGNIHALQGVSISVREREIVTLLGSNGAGKSTTLKTISGLLRPRQGTVKLRGETLNNVPAHQIVRRGICQSPEGRHVFPRLSVDENLAMGAFIHNDTKQVAIDRERVLDLFPRLRERLRQKAGTLSGGEQQMLAIGRAMMGRPTVLLLDEPSMGLSPLLTDVIFDAIKEINHSGVTVVVVEQNAQLALSIADRGYVMQTGRIVLTDTADSLVKNEMVRKAYLGEE
ncbi:MAG: ABC transporter ATP-binding protein [Chloroflexi bacterium]|nr:ABC transporter ATP-binding protein [Chloroflexota bacterium]